LKCINHFATSKDSYLKCEICNEYEGFVQFCAKLTEK
jgi:hypothetical protein